MNSVVVLSIFRDSMGYLARYFQQIKQFTELLRARNIAVRLVAVENNSTDGTFDALQRNLDVWPGSVVVQATDGCPYYPSLDMPERWRHFAWVQNHLPPLIQDDDDTALYVESDLIVAPDELVELVDLAWGWGAVTMPIFHRQKGGPFYDVWGCVKDGENFRHTHPYVRGWMEGMLPIDSCAAVLACDARHAREARFSEHDGARGWSKQIRDLNRGLWMATWLGAVHP